MTLQTAIQYIIDLEITNPELATLLLGCALEYIEVDEEQTADAEQHVTPSAAHYRRD